MAVLFGGQGPEHPVSCLSAGTILAMLDRDRYEVVPVGIAPDGRWVLAADAPERLAISGRDLPSVDRVALSEPTSAPDGDGAPESGATPGDAAQPDGEPVPARTVGPAGPAAGAPGTPARTAKPAGPAAGAPGTAPAAALLAGVDVALPVLHGPFGEDGTVQGLLELAGVPYVGAGVLASAVSMDKEYMKLVFQARGLPVGRYVVVRDRDWEPATADPAAAPAAAERKRVLDAIAELGYPVFVKPARGGSSIGTSRADDPAEAAEAIETARRYDPKVIVEAAVTGREIECAVLEGEHGGPPDTSLPGQLVLDGDEEFYDFEAKYLDPAGGIMIPAPIPAEHLAEIRRLAAAAFEAVSCEGFARVDFFYTPDGAILLNEINTIPGMTSTSYFPRMWEATGLPLAPLLDRMIATALGKRRGLR